MPKCRQWGCISLLLLVATCALSQEVSIEKNPVYVPGSIQVNLAWTDSNGQRQDHSLQTLPTSVVAVLPSALAAARSNPLLTPSFFDNSWGSQADTICKEISADIASTIHSSDNSAYDVTCTPNRHGILSAVLLDSWEDSWRVTTTGKRLQLSFQSPFTSAVFRVTSPTTCHDGSVTCQQDLQYTAVFDAHATLKFTSPDPTKLAFQFTDAHFGTLLLDDVKEGDYSGEVATAVTDFLTSIVPDAASSDYVAVAVDVAKFLAKVISIGASAISNQHLRDEVSAKLSSGLTTTSTLANLAASPSSNFDTLFTALATGATFGFRDLSVAADGKGNLILRLTMPPATAPTLANVDASLNAQPSLFQPSIGVSPPSVPAGKSVAVTGNFFAAAYTTHLTIGWGAAPAIAGGPRRTEIQWGLAAAAATATVTASTPGQTSYVFASLAPGTSYRFRARQCNPVTCSGWGPYLTTSTQSAGTDVVKLYLDSVGTVHQIGTAVVSGGTFTASVVVPGITAAGSHTVIAVLGLQTAKAALSVCGSGAATCAPVVAVVNEFVGSPVSRVVEGSKVIVSGGNFLPNGKVSVYSDPSPGGTLIGGAPVSNGAFKATFTMPYLPGPTGWHNFEARQPVLFGTELRAQVRVYVDAPPR